MEPSEDLDHIENYILDNFEDAVEVFVRRNPMVKHQHYATFVVFVKSEEELDTELLENHNWGGDIRCFFAPRGNRYRN